MINRIAVKIKNFLRIYTLSISQFVYSQRYTIIADIWLAKLKYLSGKIYQTLLFLSSFPVLKTRAMKSKGLRETYFGIYNTWNNYLVQPIRLLYKYACIFFESKKTLTSLIVGHHKNLVTFFYSSWLFYINSLKLTKNISGSTDSISNLFSLN